MINRPEKNNNTNEYIMTAPPKFGSINAKTRGINVNKKRQLKRYLLGVVTLPIVYLTVSRFLCQKLGILLNGSIERTGNRKLHQAIIKNFWTLTQLRVQSGALEGRSGQSSYGRVQATFCKIDWDLQIENPALVPMFRDLEYKSRSCMATKTTTTNFSELVQEAKAFDGFDEKNPKTSRTGYVFPPNGVVFHETRCGSTLFANLLSGFAPRESRVYSESHPPLVALKACDYISCDQDAHRALIRDVFYMMGRRPPSHNREKQRRLFFKIQSIGAMYIDKYVLLGNPVSTRRHLSIDFRLIFFIFSFSSFAIETHRLRFTMALPEVPWVFVYRDTVEIIMSHLNQGTRTTPKVCSRHRWAPTYMQPPTTMKIIEEAGKSLGDVNLIEYCAAHIAGLSLSALQEHNRGEESNFPGGRFVNYQQMPEIVWEKILPEHFGVDILSPEAISNMEQLSGVYSKARGHRVDQDWVEDSTIKQNKATPDVIKAANLFASKIYNRMKELSR